MDSETRVLPRNSSATGQNPTHVTSSLFVVPTVCLASYADFSVAAVDSFSDVGGIVSMKVCADVTQLRQLTRFLTP